MFRKLRDKISEEVQQTSLKLPVSVQQFSQLSPFGGSGEVNDQAKNLPKSTSNEVLVDISQLQPAGHNKELFSIDEDSGDGSPSKTSEFKVVELSGDSPSFPVSPQKNLLSNLVNSPFDPSSPATAITKPRRSSETSNASEISGMSPVSEVPGVLFSLTQSDLESCSSEWEDGNSLDKLSKETIYQGYLRVRQRYHKYKGRYNDAVNAYKETEKETEKLRDILTKQQDTSLRRVSELREQCTLEQQAKAHLEQELRSDLEEKDHKIEALQTKIRLLQDSFLNEGPFRSPFNVTPEAGDETPSLQLAEDQHQQTNTRVDDLDNVSVGSLGSISTAPTSLESDELIERLKGDLIKHKTLLVRCMENIKANKDRIIYLQNEKEELSDKLQENSNFILALKTEHKKELDSLRASVESSALSMAETKQQLFEELQRKEVEVEHYVRITEQLEMTVKSQTEQMEEMRNRSDEELEIDLEKQRRNQEEQDTVANLESKCTELESLVTDLQKSKKDLECELAALAKANTSDSDELIFSKNSFVELEAKKAELQCKLTELLAEVKELKEGKSEMAKEISTLLEMKNQVDFEKSKIVEELSQMKSESKLLKEENEKIQKDLEDKTSKLKHLEIAVKKSEEIGLQNVLLRKDLNSQTKALSALENQCDSLSNVQNVNKKLRDEISVLYETRNDMSKIKDTLLKSKLFSQVSFTIDDVLSKLNELILYKDKASREAEELNCKCAKYEDTLCQKFVEIESHRKDITRLESKLQELENNKMASDRKLDEARHKFQEAEASYVRKLSELEAEGGESEEDQRNIGSSKEEVVEPETTSQEMQLELKEIKHELGKCKSELIKRDDDLTDANDRISQLEHQLEVAEGPSNLVNTEAFKASLESMPGEKGELVAELRKKEVSLNQELEDARRNLEMQDEAVRKAHQLIDELRMKEMTLTQIIGKCEKKFLSMVDEKKEILNDFEHQATEYTSSLKERDKKLRVMQEEYEKRIDGITKDHDHQIEKAKKENENLAAEKEQLREEVIYLEKVKIERENLELQFKENELHRNRMEDSEAELRCELERLQKEHDIRLAETLKTRDTQLSEEEEGRRRLLARSDAEIARLKDMCDELQLQVEKDEEEREERRRNQQDEEKMREELESSNKYLVEETKDLRERLEATERQMDSQVSNIELSNRELRQKIDAVRSDFDALASLVKEITPKDEENLVNTLRKRVAELESSKAELESTLSQLRQEFGTLRDVYECKMEVWQRIDEDLSEILGEKCPDDSEGTETVPDKLKRLDKIKNEAVRELRTLKERNNQLTLETVQQRQHTNELLSQIMNLQEQNSAFEISNSLILKDIEKMKETVGQSEMRSQELVSLLDDENKEAERIVSEVKERNRGLETRLGALQGEVESEKCKVMEFERTISEMNDRKCSLESTVAEQGRKLLDFDAIIGENGELKGNLEKLVMKLKEEKDENEKVILEYEKNKIEMNQSKCSLEKRVTLLKENIDEKERSLSESEVTISKLHQSKCSLETALSSLQRQLATASSHSPSLEAQLKVLRAEVEEKKNKLMEYEKEINELTLSKASQETLRLELEGSRNVIVEYEAKMKEFTEVVAKIPFVSEEVAADATSALTFLMNENENLKQRLLEEMTGREESKKDLKELTNRLDVLKQTLAELTNRLAEKEMECDSLRSRLQSLEVELRELGSRVGKEEKSRKDSEAQTFYRVISEEDLEDSLRRCKAELLKEYENNMNEMEIKYQEKEENVKQSWKERLEESAREKEKEIEGIQRAWKEERKELERLTEVATAAFRSGTDSVDLLKKQVYSQRKELEDVKRNYKREVSELQTLLEVKRRRGRTAAGHGGGAIEDAAEFEYLQNILYQYMLGKETQTLSKVLCAVAKFSKEQQRHVTEYEEKKSSLVSNLANGLGI